MSDLQSILSRLALSDPIEVTKTDIATIWKVTQSDGTHAALKLYKALDEKDEGPGFDLLQAWQSGPAVRVLNRSKGVALLEWLDGPSLGDLSRAGGQDQADALLIETMAKCQKASAATGTSFPSLEEKIADLFKLTFAPDCPKQVQTAITACQSLGKELLASQPDRVLLHGDFHHDNVLKGARGWCVIDPKGLIGDPTYEIANAFRNPLGSDALIRDPFRTQALAVNWATACGGSPKRALAWAAVHAAASMAWCVNGVLGAFPDDDLPAFYLSQMALAQEI